MASDSDLPPMLVPVLSERFGVMAVGLLERGRRPNGIKPAGEGSGNLTNYEVCGGCSQAANGQRPNELLLSSGTIHG